jgi:MFS family permease
MANTISDIEKSLGTKSQLGEDASSPAKKNDAVPDVEDASELIYDRGLLAWSQVLAGNLINCMTWGYPATFGVYQLYYKDVLQVPQAQISWIGSIQVFLAFMMCTVSGRLADAGYIRQTLIAGEFLVVFGTFMTSLATQYWEIFLAQGICTGLGLGIMFMPAISVISSYFKEKRSLALALAATGTGFGSLVFPSTIQYLIPRIGFPWAVRCSAFVALFVSVISILLLKPRLAPRRAGPLVEWDAFKEAPYVLFASGSFLIFWALYFGFFYVRELPSLFYRPGR